MKIGVFGDSFAERNSSPKIWWQCLKRNHNHQVESFGAGGSSILYSAKLIEKNYHNYDFIIWCFACQGRISFEISKEENNYFHYSLGNKRLLNDVSLEIQKKIQICNEYTKYFYDGDDDMLVSNALANYFLSKYKNLMIIPCFRYPLNLDFNLYILSSKEIQSLFPGQTYETILQKYNDTRPGHLSAENSAILADIVNRQLQPGIFQTDYSNFKTPVGVIEDFFSKRK